MALTCPVEFDVETLRSEIADIVIGETLSGSALRDIDLWTG